MLELQQQLCDAEGAAESLRDANSTLRGANRDLTSKLEVLRADSSNETHEAMWRQSQVHPGSDAFVDVEGRFNSGTSCIILEYWSTKYDAHGQSSVTRSVRRFVL